MSAYRTCPICGANLDCGEVCDCQRQNDGGENEDTTSVDPETRRRAVYERYEAYKKRFQKGENRNGFKKGDAFVLGGVYWQAFETGADWLKCISVEPLVFRPFDEKNNNDFASSDIRNYINEDFLNTLLKRGVDRGIFLKFPVDLTTRDGRDYYGWDLTTVGLITYEEYMEAKQYIRPSESAAWWTATPGNAQYSNCVCAIKKDGDVVWRIANAKRCGVRPVCLLDTERLVIQKEKDRRRNAISMMRFIKDRWKINKNEVY